MLEHISHVVDTQQEWIFCRPCQPGEAKNLVVETALGEFPAQVIFAVAKPVAEMPEFRTTLRRLSVKEHQALITEMFINATIRYWEAANPLDPQVVQLSEAKLPNPLVTPLWVHNVASAYCAGVDTQEAIRIINHCKQRVTAYYEKRA